VLWEGVGEREAIIISLSVSRLRNRICKVYQWKSSGKMTDDYVKQKGGKGEKIQIYVARWRLDAVGWRGSVNV